MLHARTSVLALCAMLLAACTSAGSGPPTSEPASPAPVRTSASASSGGTARAMLASLPTKGRAPKTGYTRARFGTAWTDDTDDPLGHNGCDTRNDVLRRDLTDETLKARTSGCVVLAGTLHDPYTARTISFHRGESTSAAVQIDHVVALGDAWQTGAQQLTEQQRTDLANDPLELLAVDGPTNGAKGDGDAATWLPPNKAYRCAYVARQIAVKVAYHLWVTAAERAAMTRVLSTCPGQPVPAEAGAAAVRLAPHSVAPSARPTSASSPASTTHGVYYNNCAAARAAGAAPLHRGDPGYSARLDRDGDGVACE